MKPISVRAWRASFNVAPACPVSERHARIYMLWFDHEILRHVWANEAVVAPGVIRSNQPTFARLARLQRQGLRSVLSLRGMAAAPHGRLAACCDRLGLPLRVIPMSSRRPPDRDRLLELIGFFRAAEGPFLMHCKSGADRTGLAAAIYLMAIEGQRVEDARRMLSPRYLHFRWSRAGILDRFLDAYSAQAGTDGRNFEDWLRCSYDPAALT